MKRTLADAMRFGTEEEAVMNHLVNMGWGSNSLHSAMLNAYQSLQNRRVSRLRDDGLLRALKMAGSVMFEMINDADEKLNSPWGVLDLSKKGTLVIWEDIDKLPIGKSG